MRSQGIAGGGFLPIAGDTSSQGTVLPGGHQGIPHKRDNPLDDLAGREAVSGRGSGGSVFPALANRGGLPALKDDHATGCLPGQKPECGGEGILGACRGVQSRP